ncbi:precorrin-8X methylmutase CbiC/CobH [Anopheles sinensis]|uniref:Precorrin-8X methylmutase CbiC/CobH n=1 Tax=Anopheles sinensis TaxID=74873 RepID=A0A084W556_ANOSI|nr:precorrin-8X methylmutase CbiC/CobH [Anopheles sinensis]
MDASPGALITHNDTDTAGCGVIMAGGNLRRDWEPFPGKHRTIVPHRRLLHTQRPPWSIGCPEARPSESREVVLQAIEILTELRNAQTFVRLELRRTSDLPLPVWTCQTVVVSRGRRSDQIGRDQKQTAPGPGLRSLFEQAQGHCISVVGG